MSNLFSNQPIAQIELVVDVWRRLLVHQLGVVAEIARTVGVGAGLLVVAFALVTPAGALLRAVVDRFAVPWSSTP
jgi:hypothetical protein